MKKLSFIILAVVCAFTFTAGSAWALSTLDMCTGAPFIVGAPDVDVAGTTTGAVTIASQLMNIAREVDLNDGDALATNFGGQRFLTYIPNIALKANATLEFTFVNGAIESTLGNVYYLVLDTGLPGGATAATMTDYITNANGDYTWMRFQITNVDRNLNLASNDPGEDRVNSGEFLVFSETADDNADGVLDITDPTVVVNAGLAVGQSVTAQLTMARDDNSNTVNAPLTATENLVTVVDGLNTTFTMATSTIDVEATPSRANFVVPDITDTTATTSFVSNLMVDPTLAEFGFLLNAADTYTMTITRNNADGVVDTTAGVQWGLGLANSTTHVVGSTTWTFTGNFGDVVGGDLLAGTCWVQINVNGTDVLETGDWLFDLTINTDEVAGADDQIELNQVVSHRWGINGCQLILPYNHRNTAMYGTYLVLSNINTNDAEIFADVFTDGGVADGTGLTAGQRVATNILIGTVTGRSTRILMPDDIENAVNTALGGLAHARYMLRLTVIAPVNDIFPAAFQNQGSLGKRAVPVYTNFGSGNRQWQE